jgi:hypothetical protein
LQDDCITPTKEIGTRWVTGKFSVYRREEQGERQGGKQWEKDGGGEGTSRGMRKDPSTA